jgi:2-polyprenyl-3-methyl-5-hydroxy-6-metoxy-1,4-benzoquinol methylase
MEFTLKNYPCSLCSKDKTDILLTKQGFSIVQCCNCGFVYVNPRVENEQLTSIYRHNYFANKDYGYVSYEQEKILRVKNFERWLKDSDKYITDANPIFALDVGCAAGYCLELMKARGWKANGLELDEEMCISLKGKGFNISQSLLEDFKTENSFSVITLFDVIEHIPNIDKAFSKLNSLLTKDGVVIMVTPNYKSFQRKLLGKKWFQYKPIEHIQYFDKKSLSALAERNGLKIVYQTKCGQYADTQFLLNRLNYYHFSFLSKFFNKIFGMLKLKDKFFYTDTGSLFVILKRR